MSPSWRVNLADHLPSKGAGNSAGLAVRSTGDSDVSENPQSFYTDFAPAIGATVPTDERYASDTLTITRSSDGHTYVSGVDFEETDVNHWTNLTIPEGTAIVVDYLIDEDIGVGSGAPGPSAYEIAVENGFVGTEEEWLESLVGEPGISAYEEAVANGFVGTEEEWLISLRAYFNDRGAYDSGSIYMKWDLVGFANSTWLVRVDDLSGVTPAEGTYYTLLAGPGPQGIQGIQGVQGISAYQVAVANGFSGTQAQWLASLEGADGFTMRVRYNGSLMPLRSAINFRSGHTLSDDNVNDWVNVDSTGGSGGTGGAASYTSLVKLGAV